MLQGSIYQIRENFVLVEQMGFNPLYPRYIVVDKKNISATFCSLGYIGYVTPIGSNQYRFQGA